MSVSGSVVSEKDGGTIHNVHLTVTTSSRPDVPVLSSGAFSFVTAPGALYVAGEYGMIKWHDFECVSTYIRIYFTGTKEEVNG